MSIIDPRFSGQDSLAFSAYFGGAGVDRPTALAVEASGAFVVAGYSNSSELPGPNMSNTLQGLNRGGYDAFVIRVEPELASALTYATYLGSEGSDFATAIAVDKVGISGSPDTRRHLIFRLVQTPSRAICIRARMRS